MRPIAGGRCRAHPPPSDRSRNRPVLALQRGAGYGGHMNERELRKKRDKELIELLNELRVALPGAQVLFAFLLVVPFSSRFDVDRTEKIAYMIALLATLARRDPAHRSERVPPAALAREEQGADAAHLERPRDRRARRDRPRHDRVRLPRHRRAAAARLPRRCSPSLRASRSGWPGSRCRSRAVRPLGRRADDGFGPDGARDA